MKKTACIIPCFNERDNLKTLCLEINSVDNGLIDWYLINNGSTDISNFIFKEEVKKYNYLDSIKTFYVKNNIGYGNGLKQLILNNLEGYETIVWTHADGQTPISDVIKAFNISIKYHHIDLIKGIRISRKDGFIASVFTIMLNIILTILGNYNNRSPNSQPTLIRTNLLNRIITKAEDDGNFDISILLNAKKIKNINLIRFPVEFNNRRNGIGSNEKFFDKVRYSLGILRYILSN